MTLYGTKGNRMPTKLGPTPIERPGQVLCLYCGLKLQTNHNAEDAPIITTPCMLIVDPMMRHGSNGIDCEEAATASGSCAAIASLGRPEDAVIAATAWQADSWPMLEAEIGSLDGWSDETMKRSNDQTMKEVASNTIVWTPQKEGPVVALQGNLACQPSDF
jgi:hypothetical protein